MNTYWLRFTLESDATFGRGDGIPGLIDQDVALDREGFPYLHGRTLKGLLNEVCADILYALRGRGTDWSAAANGLFGEPGSDDRGQGVMSVGHAQLPEALRQAARYELARKTWTSEDITRSLTTVRRQTAVEVRGAPDPNTLRSVRVILRETPFEARLDCMRDLTSAEKGLLAACVKGLRRAGTARNRGRGLLSTHLQDGAGGDLGETWYREHFRSKVEVHP